MAEAKKWAVPGGTDPTPTTHTDTMDKNHAGGIGEFAGNENRPLANDNQQENAK